MRIKILKNKDEDFINNECNKLEDKGYKILDIVYTPQSYRHFETTIVIKCVQIKGLK